MNHLVLIRFSVIFNQSKFATNDKVELLHPSRLNKRFFYFENICLKSLINQTNKNYKCIIIIDKDIPQYYLIKLQNLIKSLKHIFIHEWDINDNINKNDWLRKYQDNKHKYSIYTRLDDDDGLSTNYMQIVENMFKKVKNMIDDTNIFFNCSRGNYLINYNNKYYLKYVRFRQIALGLAYFTLTENNISVFNYDHSRLKNYDNLRLLDDGSKFNMFICTAHIHNDSNRYKNMISKIKNLKEIDLTDVYDLMGWK